jgi:hypothetical protein
MRPPAKERVLVKDLPRLSIYLPLELHRAFMHRAIDEGVSASKLAERLILEYLKTPLRKGK